MDCSTTVPVSGSVLPTAMFLVDANWYRNWQSGITNSLEHPTKNLIASGCLTGPVLRSNLNFGKDCIAVSQATWSEIIEQSPKCEEIKRYQLTEDGIIETNLIYVSALLLSNELLESFQKDESIGEKLILAVEFSLHMTVVQLSKIIECFLVKNNGLDSGTFSVRIWKLELKDASLRRKIKQISAQLPHCYKFYHVKIQGLLLDQNKTFEECAVTPLDSLLIEIVHDNIQCVYSKDHHIYSRCPKCNKLTSLTFGCQCRTNRFCSQTCISHMRPCPHQIRRSLPVSNQRVQEMKKLSEIKYPTNSYISPKYTYVGLKNLGNTCYINASIQCLANIPELIQYYKSHSFDNKNKKNSVAIALKNLFDSMTCGKFREVSASDLKKQIGKINPHFSGYNQHDSHEFLSYLIDAISEVKPDMLTMNSDLLSGVAPHKLFYGEYKSTLQCDYCTKQQKTNQPFLSINLHIPASATFKFIIIDGIRQLIVQNDMLLTQLKPFVETQLLTGLNIPHPHGLVFWNQLGLVDLQHYDISDASCLTIMSRRLMQHQYLSEHYIRTRFTQCKSNYGNENYRTDIIKPVMIGYNKSDTLREMHMKLRKWFGQIYSSQQGEDKSRSEFQVFVSAEKCVLCPVCSKNCYGCPVLGDETTMEEFIDGLKVKAGNPNIEVVFEYYSKNKLTFNIDRQQIKIVSQNPLMKQLTLSKCLEEFSKPEKLSVKNGWKCSLCDKPVSAIKTLQISKFPEYLIIHFKRFDRFCKSKINTLVSFPITGLEITKHLTEQLRMANNNVVYNLASICNHYGKIDFGHYTAHCSTKDGWMQFNDCQYSGISPESLSPSENAYFMFYKLQR